MTKIKVKCCHVFKHSREEERMEQVQEACPNQPEKSTAKGVIHLEMFLGDQENKKVESGLEWSKTSREVKYCS